MKVTGQEEGNKERPREREKKLSICTPDKESRDAAKVSSEPVANIENEEMERAEKEWLCRWVGGDNRNRDGGKDRLYTISHQSCCRFIHKRHDNSRG